MTNAPVHIMEIREAANGGKKFINHYDMVDKILLHDDVKNRKIVTLSIIGEFRKGKSFLLDYCLRFMYANYKSVSGMSKPLGFAFNNWLGDPNEPLIGFSWKHGRVADTKGILFWSNVFLYDSPLGEKIAIIIMDTQGLFEPHSTPDENARIFGLSTLISSTQILNAKTEIQENQVEYLETATNLTKSISKFKSSKWKPFQKLIFLIRDWTDEDTGYGYSGGSNYLKEILKPGHTETKAQSIRVNIHESFDSIECFLLNPPGSEVTKKDFGGEHGRLDAEFVENLKTLIESVLKPENLNKKSILGKDVTGWDFRDVIYAYLEAFKNTKLPNIENIFHMTIDSQMMAIVTEQVQEYQKSMNENLNFEQEDFEVFIDSKHESQKGAAIARFSKVNKFEDDKSIAKFIKVLVEDIEKSFVTWKVAIMRDYKQFIEFKRKIDELNLEKEERAKKFDELQKNMEAQAQDNMKLQQEFEEKMKRQQHQSDHLIAQLDSMNFTVADKKQKMQEFKETIRVMTDKYEKSRKDDAEKIQMLEKSSRGGAISSRDIKDVRDLSKQIKSNQKVNGVNDRDQSNVSQEQNKELTPLHSIRNLVNALAPKLKARADIMKKKREDAEKNQTVMIRTSYDSDDN